MDGRNGVTIALPCVARQRSYQVSARCPMPFYPGRVDDGADEMDVSAAITDPCTVC